MQLHYLVDGFDAMVSLLEWRDRGDVDQAVAGGLAFNLAGLACWTIAATCRMMRPSATLNHSSWISRTLSDVSELTRRDSGPK